MSFLSRLSSFLKLAMSAPDSTHTSDKEGAAPLPLQQQQVEGDHKQSDEDIASFDDLARKYAEQEVRQTLMPHLTKLFLVGHPFVDFSANERIIPFIAAVLKDKKFTTEPVDDAPVPAGMPRRPGLRVYLHAKPGDKLPEPQKWQQKPQQKQKRKK